jgi:hypothetical protein
MEPLDLDRIDLDMLTTALQDQQGYEHRWLLDPNDGELHVMTEDGLDGAGPTDLEELDLIPVDPLPSRVWYHDMADFAGGISDEQAGRRLARAIRGRGAFRHFKDELHEEYPELVEAWYAFRDARARERAIEWLVGRSYPAAHPVPPLP